MSGTATLTWFADRGFELELSADLEDIQLRFAALPVPADGTIELEKGVELNKLDMLFKCQAAIDGAPAQLQDATIAVRDGKLHLAAGLEDVENGLLYPLEAEIPVRLPSGVPAAGGPRNQSPDEDDLDWGDETTFEAVAGDVPDAALLTEERDLDDDSDFGDEPEPDDDEPEEKPRGLAALLQALKNLDDEDAEPVAPVTEEVPMPPKASPPSGDQKMGPIAEAVSLLRLLIDREELEMEDDHEPEELGSGVASILATPMSFEKKASVLSEWLLEQPQVADLYVDDETLGEILSEW
ncbi:MAG: hypothetical protein H6737_25885 [Alphaproteobacteria bacterium]|nr:hypothetical protein [Alphaproteobacteria bacterium]